MELVPPSPAFADSFAEALKEYREAGEQGFWEGAGNPEDVTTYIETVNGWPEGRNLPNGWIPVSVFWLIDKGEYVGHISIRHRLTEHLRTVGGHIGYIIRPTKRQQGYGRKILELALPEAKALGIDHVLVTCDATNEASQKIIEANGGVFERAQNMGPDAPEKLLYWIAM